MDFVYSSKTQKLPLSNRIIIGLFYIAVIFVFLNLSVLNPFAILNIILLAALSILNTLLFLNHKLSLKLMTKLNYFLFMPALTGTIAQLVL